MTKCQLLSRSSEFWKTSSAILSFIASQYLQFCDEIDVTFNECAFQMVYNEIQPFCDY